MILRRVLYSSIVAIPIFYAGAVLFGAPLLSNFEDTFVFAVVLSLFTVAPLVWSCGLGSRADDAFCNLLFEGRFVNKRQFTAYRAAIGAIFGAFLGSVFIPLDWDFYWQKWPISCVLGSVGGVLVGVLLAQIEVATTHAKIVYGQSKLV